jgi:hypothetical protein
LGTRCGTGCSECNKYQRLLNSLLSLSTNARTFFKHLLETRSEFGAFSRTHKLQKLLEELIAYTAFRTDKSKYTMALQVITVCAEEYRYNSLIDCSGYKQSVEICNELLTELLNF